MIVETYRDDTRIFRGEIDEPGDDTNLHGWVLNQTSYAMARQGKEVEIGDVLSLGDGTRWVKEYGTFKELNK